MTAQADAEGFGGCTNHGECEAACPKGIPLQFIGADERRLPARHAAAGSPRVTGERRRRGLTRPPRRGVAAQRRVRRDPRAARAAGRLGFAACRARRAPGAWHRDRPDAHVAVVDRRALPVEVALDAGRRQAPGDLEHDGVVAVPTRGMKSGITSIGAR